ncbi:MAG: bile acid:sodium symporter family protein [Melioribacteraceae bacterium]|nr:bile acid:sodium symporter family protein [Melioribacteraceae bacterium]
MIHKITNLFPVWAVLLSVLAFQIPDLFVSLSALIIPLLVLVMFGMGITLTADNFKEVLTTPKIILLGISLQYFVMPLAAYIISIFFGFSAGLTAGMVLVGSSPGGTASNVITYLAKGKVALSITLTLLSTLLAAFATPYLSYLYLNQIVYVPVGDMFLNVIKIVLLPVVAGLIINTYFGNNLEKFKPVFPLISVISIVIIIAIIVALNREKLVDMGYLVVLGVVIHNSSGLLLGYILTRIFGYDTSTCRTIAIEVGMQNSGLAVALAIKFFGSAAALPGAVFSVWHNLSGSLLAVLWGKDNKKPRQ